MGGCNGGTVSGPHLLFRFLGPASPDFDRLRFFSSRAHVWAHARSTEPRVHLCARRRGLGETQDNAIDRQVSKISTARGHINPFSAEKADAETKWSSTRIPCPNCQRANMMKNVTVACGGSRCHSRPSSLSCPSCLSSEIHRAPRHSNGEWLAHYSCDLTMHCVDNGKNAE